MIPQALRSFIRELQSATEKCDVFWNEADALAYYCNHKNYTLHISSHFDEDREVSSFYFRVNANGKSTPFSVNDSEESDYETMRGLYEAIIVNANDVINDIKGFFEP